MERKKVDVLGIPLDIVSPEQLEQVVISLTEKPGTKQIILLSVWDLLRAKRDKEYCLAVINADLVIPVSKSLIFGARFLHNTVPVRYNPFSIIISILGILDSHYKTLYLLGAKKTVLMQTERNIRSTFSNLQIVGRYASFKKNAEKNVITALYKASPSLVLMSKGGCANIRWVYKHRNDFSSSIFLWNKNVFDIFSARKKRIPDSAFDKGLEIFYEIIKNPFKIFLVFPFLWYLLILAAVKIGKKG